MRQPSQHRRHQCALGVLHRRAISRNDFRNVTNAGGAPCETTVEPAFITPPDPPSEEERSATDGESATDTESEAGTEDETLPDAEPQVETDEEGPDPELNPEGSDAESSEPPAPKGQDVGELVRLASLMRWVDEDCGVVPIGGMVLDAHYNLVRNVVFPGLEFSDKLDSYGHLFRGYERATLAKDITGFWSLQQQPLTNDVTIRSLLWPGYHMYYSGSTYDFGSLYFGWGEKNLDIAFMIN
ncbi:hypothetical protein R1flu_023503 [Riccia fluitans]|uniref:Radial spoke head protein 9 homolog n=1 Tax=Riccia fluitans TaxID=41844 RepID=A0ABD1XSA5_9MARC